ncbi:endomembrane protein 70-like protein [Podospora aff. communis PSN243]|uniref:Endomembrane protein 70-like protein n=1 Tax=Podospora aff. communis PSN243 TaxID=3040156 RepID=A0AAV9GFM7_9PEZI|nr:endomembrane protein 70-like protein [Podospora aff. communis PSN243]
MTSPTPLQKTTHTIAVHDIPIECDVYNAADYPANAPVFLFFHSGGLTGGARNMVPPWLVQTCLTKKWPLLSPSYRLLPQVSASGLLDDVRAAYTFAQSFGTSTPEDSRKVIVGGASAGFFLAALVAHHLTPPPLALLSITGIPSFRHAFFNSSTLIPSEPITEDDIAPYVSEPVTVGRHIFDASGVFSTASLLPSGEKNTAWTPGRKLPEGFTSDPNRGLLYDYYLHENLFLDFVGEVDAGFDWATVDEQKLEAWPPTIFIHGDDDADVDLDVCASTVKQLGDKAQFFLAKGKGHLFEKGCFLEDLGDDKDSPTGAVLKAIDALDRVVAAD